MIYENIVNLCKEQNVSIAKVEKECGFGNATIRSWSVSSPSIAKVQKVAAYFKVTVEDLLKEEEETNVCGN